MITLPLPGVFQPGPSSATRLSRCTLHRSLLHTAWWTWSQPDELAGSLPWPESWWWLGVIWQCYTYIAPRYVKRRPYKTHIIWNRWSLSCINSTWYSREAVQLLPENLLFMPTNTLKTQHYTPVYPHIYWANSQRTGRSPRVKAFSTSFLSDKSTPAWW